MRKSEKEYKGRKKYNGDIPKTKCWRCPKNFAPLSLNLVRSKEMRNSGNG